MATTPDSVPPRDETSARGSSYLFHQTLASSWKEALMVLPLILLGAGAILWIGHQPTLRQQARVEVTETVKAIGTTGRTQTDRTKISTAEPMAVGTTGVVSNVPVSRNAMAPVKRILPGDVIITVPSGSAEDRLSAFLESAPIGATRITIDRIAFGNGSAQLTARSRDQVDRIATILRSYPGARVVVAGYTDNTGSEALNLSLSRDRSRAVTDRLVKDGIASGRVRAEGFGSQQPIADNATARGRSQNRRVVLEVNVE